jgi:hypothetical protein
MLATHAHVFLDISRSACDAGLKEKCNFVLGLNSVLVPAIVPRFEKSPC